MSNDLVTPRGNRSRIRRSLAFWMPGILLGSLVTAVFGALPALQAQSVSPLTVQPDTGRVGINTDTPARTLDVNGDARVAGEITTTGRIGVGTSTPAFTLDVAGQIRATTGTAVYVPHTSCGGTVLTTSTTCSTNVCKTSGDLENPHYRLCSGVCPNTPNNPSTCSNTLLGRLVAP